MLEDISLIFATDYFPKSIRSTLSSCFYSGNANPLHLDKAFSCPRFDLLSPSLKKTRLSDYLNRKGLSSIFCSDLASSLLVTSSNQKVGLVMDSERVWSMSLANLLPRTQDPRNLIYLSFERATFKDGVCEDTQAPTFSHYFIK